MHRFRQARKSDAKRPQGPEQSANPTFRGSSQFTLPNQHSNPIDSLPDLPPTGDFRTSLILPSLSRRFTLLRAPNGDPVSLDDIRSKFAEQRARGDEHQISEEEEDMVVQALGQLRSADGTGVASVGQSTHKDASAAFSTSTGGTFASQQDSSVHLLHSGDSDYPSSITSGIASSITSSIASSHSSTYPRPLPSPSSPSARTPSAPRHSVKRNSNNLFGSGRFHDTSYIRSVTKTSVASNRGAASVAGSDSHGGSARSMRSFREDESIPDTGGNPSLSPEQMQPPQTRPRSPYSPLSAVPPRLTKDLTPQQVKRASLALEEVFRDIEEEAEETIMIPRRSLSRTGTVNSRPQSPKLPETPSAVGTPIPWMTDEARVDDRDEEEIALPSSASTSKRPSNSPSPSPGPYPRPGTVSPTPRLPGYIPGMTRPLTPRDVESDRDDGATGYSTTPRARSPAQPHFFPEGFIPSRHQHHSSVSSDGLSILPPSILRPSRASPQVPPLRTASPGFSGRVRGSSTSSPTVPSPIPSPSPDDRYKSDFLSRRPMSPFISPLTSTSYGNSRPGTPSASWTPSSPLARGHNIPARESNSPKPGMPGHNRNGSSVSANSAQTEGVPAVMPLSSPALTSSPFIDEQQSSNNSFPNFGIWEQTQNQNQNRDLNVNGGHEKGLDSPTFPGEVTNSRPSAVAAKIAARVPTPVHTHSRSSTASESGHGAQESMLLHRNVSKRGQKRLPTPPPHIQPQAHTPVVLHTPSSSSTSSSNANVSSNMYSNPSPLFSPMLNTSASSLVSVGSSYHSWADEKGKKGGWDQLVEYDTQRSAWHDMKTSGVGLNEADDASETLPNPEQVLHSLTGLKKCDLAEMQSRLVADALIRREFDPSRSPSRRRRISNSRASLSVAQSGHESGANSPAPPPRQHTPVTENGHTSSLPKHVLDNTSRANALLDSVLNSIQSRTNTSTSSTSDAPSAEPPSSVDDDSSSKLPSISSSGRESNEDDASALRLKALAEAISVSEKKEAPSNNPPKPTSPTSEPSQSLEEDSGEATEVPPSNTLRSPQPFPLRSPNDTAQLARDVSRKAAAATAALKNSSQTKVGEPDASTRRRNTRRIDLQKIGSPQLVSSSTSVDALPIAQQTPQQASSPTPDSRSPSKLSQRFKKLRGTLRTKPATPTGDEVPPFLSTPSSSYSASHPTSSPPGVQTLRYKHELVAPGATSATEAGRFKVSVPSPPASAGPGLKGFMARFRKQRKDTETNAEDLSRYQSPDSVSPVSPAHEHGHHGFTTSPPATAKPRRSHDRGHVSPIRARSPTQDPATVNQLFNAASELGLDHGALNELLARSTSTSSRAPAWKQASTSALAVTRSNSTANRTAPPKTRETRSFDQPRTSDQLPRPTPRNGPVNRPPEGEIVRRTIIFAGDNPELNASVQKSPGSGLPSRSASVTSVQSTGSATREPPVPRLPANLGSSQAANAADSKLFYNPYSQEQGSSAAQNGSIEPSSLTAENVPSDSPPGESQGPALEVLQLSNGQVIWSVLDSLRAADEDDTESLFRRSMASSRGNDVDDLEVRFKEHRRWSSKGSNYSQGSHVSRRRPVAGPGVARPETKLFKTNSSTIGRLIEDLSKNMDAGSFNFMRTTAGTPSTSTSFHSDASGSTHQVERDLEALLNAINSPR